MVLGFFLTLPVLFLSAAFFPKPLLPGWLQAVTAAVFVPLTVTAFRAAS